MAGQDGSPFADVVRADGLFDEIGRRKVAWHGIEFIGRKKVQRPLLGLGKGQETGFILLDVDGADVGNGVGRQVGPLQDGIDPISDWPAHPCGSRCRCGR